MGRRKKSAKQEFSFPSESQPITGFEKPEDLKADAEKKKEVKKAADEIPEIFTPSNVEFVFDLYAGIISFVFSILLKAEFKPIFQELKFEDAEKKAMAVPLAKIASKYAPHEWAGMQAEIELVTSIGLYTVMGFKRAQAVAAKESEKKKAPPKPSAVPVEQRIHIPVPV